LSKPRPAFKLWLETDKGYVFGPGVYNLLKSIEEKGTLKDAAKSLEMSYRYAWGLIREAEERLGESLIEATKGGRSGGGSTETTKLGKEFIEDFENLQKVLTRASSTHQMICGNELTGTILDVEHEKDSVTLTICLSQLTTQFYKTELDYKKGDKIRLKIIIEDK
jgi:molybdate transport repressor ModE-like protein